jgi:hypothetical protein
VQALKNKRYKGENSALAPVVGSHDEHDVFDTHHCDQRPQYEREHAVDVGFRRAETVLRLKALTQRVKRTGADVAINDAERE